MNNCLRSLARQIQYTQQVNVKKIYILSCIWCYYKMLLICQKMLFITKLFDIFLKKWWYVVMVLLIGNRVVYSFLHGVRYICVVVLSDVIACTDRLTNVESWNFKRGMWLLKILILLLIIPSFWTCLPRICWKSSSMMTFRYRLIAYHIIWSVSWPSPIHCLKLY